MPKQKKNMNSRVTCEHLPSAIENWKSTIIFEDILITIWFEDSEKTRLIKIYNNIKSYNSINTEDEAFIMQIFQDEALFNVAFKKATKSLVFSDNVESLYSFSWLQTTLLEMIINARIIDFLKNSDGGIIELEWNQTCPTDTDWIENREREVSRYTTVKSLSWHTLKIKILQELQGFTIGKNIKTWAIYIYNWNDSNSFEVIEKKGIYEDDIKDLSDDPRYSIVKVKKSYYYLFPSGEKMKNDQRRRYNLHDIWDYVYCIWWRDESITYIHKDNWRKIDLIPQERIDHFINWFLITHNIEKMTNSIYSLRDSWYILSDLRSELDSYLEGEKHILRSMHWDQVFIFDFSTGKYEVQQISVEHSFDDIKAGACELLKNHNSE